MNKLVTFPKFAHIKFLGDDLDIWDHKVVHSRGLLYWVLEVITSCKWNVVLSQMIQQGIRFDVFREECLHDLRDPKKFADLLMFVATHTRPTIRFHLASNMAGRQIAGDIIKKLENCKNWVQFYNVLRPGGDFLKKIGTTVHTELKKPAYLKTTTTMMTSWLEVYS